MTHPLTEKETLLVAIEECELNEYVDECILEYNLEECEKQLLKFARIVYDRAVEDVIKVMQGQGWSDYEGTLYYPDDGVENVGDAIRKQLYSQVVDLPQANSDVCGEEGAMRAFERTAYENMELMRKLADS